MTVAARSKVYGWLIAGITGLNPTAFMDIRLLCCVSSGHRDGFIAVSEESYWICLSNCV